jgi:hypothetical protein
MGTLARELHSESGGRKSNQEQNGKGYIYTYSEG